jgi:2-polyprenyl-6-methoxyphenol hydroxylase-like FAD-dependent oxidoreductase
VCLAESLATAPTVPEALGRYEALRVERANTVQRWSRLVSDTSMPEERARCALRDLSCRLAPPAQWLASLETLLVPGTPPWRALAPSGSLGVQ